MRRISRSFSTTSIAIRVLSLLSSRPLPPANPPFVESNDGRFGSFPAPVSSSASLRRMIRGRLSVDIRYQKDVEVQTRTYKDYENGTESRPLPMVREQDLP